MCYDFRKFGCEFEILRLLCVPILDHEMRGNPEKRRIDLNVIKYMAKQNYLWLGDRRDPAMMNRSTRASYVILQCVPSYLLCYHVIFELRYYFRCFRCLGPNSVARRWSLDIYKFGTISYNLIFNVPDRSLMVSGIGFWTCLA